MSEEDNLDIRYVLVRLGSSHTTTGQIQNGQLSTRYGDGHIYKGEYTILGDLCMKQAGKYPWEGPCLKLANHPGPCLWERST